jgi:hypothetical protein
VPAPPADRLDCAVALQAGDRKCVCPFPSGQLYVGCHFTHLVDNPARTLSYLLIARGRVNGEHAKRYQRGLPEGRHTTPGAGRAFLATARHPTR